MDKLHFATPGIPSCTKGDTIAGISMVRTLGLDGMELEFVRSINISTEKAPLVKKQAEKENVVLTVHAPYFINLNAAEKEKLSASRLRILNSCRIGNMCGAWSVCFHPAFYQKHTPEDTLKRVRAQLVEICEVLKAEKNPIFVRPETMGRVAQFGTLAECLSLCDVSPQVMPVLDFSHLYARYQSMYNSYKDFSNMLDEIEKKLGKRGLHNMHIHASGIAYGDKGEKNHLVFADSDFNYKEMLKALIHYDVRGVLVCESPSMEVDTRKLKDEYVKLTSK